MKIINTLKKILFLMGLVLTKKISFARRMKKGIALLFILIHCFATTEAHELAKLPELFHHFKEHQKENPSLGFVKFIIAHYASKHGEKSSHTQLPFKTHFVHCDNAPILYCAHQEIAYQKRVLYATTKEENHFKEAPYFFLQTNSIFQPPRFC